ncbi:MAG: thiamine pyrophosphokinase [Pedobacter sp.]|nr:MAG: thiamine pyrophosphokinase [Pedobacter sp.]
MSSHHIVKEKQEPALYIQDLTQFDLELLGQLLEWSPSVFVAVDAYEQVNSLGIKVDFIVSLKKLEPTQESTAVINLDPSDIGAFLKHLIALDYPAVNIIGLNKKFDDVYPYLNQINIVLFTPTQKTFAIKPGFKVWKAAGTILEIEILKYHETSNLRPTDNGQLEVIKDGFIEVNFSGDYLFLSENLE